MLKKKIIILCFVGLILVIGIVSGIRISKYAKEISERPMFYSKEVELGKYKEFSLEDYYITNKLIGEKRYYIDDNSDLWGYGYKMCIRDRDCTFWPRIFWEPMTSTVKT